MHNELHDPVYAELLACIGMDNGATDCFLSEVHHAIHSTIVPIPAYLLGICAAGLAEARLFQRYGSRCVAHPQMQSLGWIWL